MESDRRSSAEPGPRVEEEAPYLVCVQCARVFSSARSLLDHGTECKKERESTRKSFQCSICCRSFKSLTSLRNHSRTHPTQPLNQLHNTLTQPGAIPTVTGVDTDIMVGEGPNISHMYDVSPTDSSMNMSVVAATRDLRVSTPMEPGSRRLSLNCNISTVRTTRRRSAIPIPITRRLSLAYIPHSPASVGRDSIGNSSVRSSKTANSVIKDATLPIEGNVSSSKVGDALGSSDRRNRILTPSRIRLTPKRGRQVPKYRRLEHEVRIAAARDASIQRSRTLVAGTAIQTRGQASPRTPTLTPRNSRKLNRSRSRTHSSVKRTKTPNTTPVTPCSARRTPLSARKTPLTPISGKKTPLSVKKCSQLEISSPGCKTHKCSKCGKCFVNKAQLDVHFLVHIRETPKRCGVAMETVKRNLRSLQFKPDASTVDTPRPESVGPYVCTECGRSYDQERFLLAHMKTHTLTKAYQCNQCDKKFKQQTNLRLHLLVHKNEARDVDVTQSRSERPKVSSIEEDKKDGSMVRNVFSILKDATFDDISDLIEQFACKSCAFKTREPASLLLHMRTHSKPRKYMCTMCDKSYSSESNLKVHTKVHTIGRIKNILLTRHNLRNVGMECLGLERLDTALLQQQSRKLDVPDTE